MKHLVWMAAAALALAACDNSVNGTLKVDNAFQVDNNDGDTIAVAAGTYASTLRMKDSKTLEVQFKMDGDKQDVRIRLPKGTSLPTDGNGQFFIKGDDVGTAFDIKGTLSTAVANGPEQQGVATCYLPPPPPICYPVPMGGTACTQEPPRQGYMQVTYHLQTTTTKASAEFTASSNSGHLASFSGTNTDTAEIYDYQGFCN